jgi:hypothetical protein
VRPLKNNVLVSVFKECRQINAAVSKMQMAAQLAMVKSKLQQTNKKNKIFQNLFFNIFNI